MGARWSSQRSTVTTSRCISNTIQDKMATASSSTPATVSAILSNDSLKEVLRRAKEPNSKLLVLEFTAPWSEPCKFMRPSLEQIAARFKDYADFYVLDVEQFKLVLEFTAPWSEPCKFMRPSLEQIAARFKDYADFYVLDVEQFKTFARNTRVEALPTFLLVRTAVLDRVVGVSKDELERMQCSETHLHGRPCCRRDRVQKSIC